MTGLKPLKNNADIEIEHGSWFDNEYFIKMHILEYFTERGAIFCSGHGSHVYVRTIEIMKEWFVNENMKYIEL
jgi:hypothetical protein